VESEEGEEDSRGTSILNDPLPREPQKKVTAWFLNVCSLNETKKADLLSELANREWDFFGVAETWRKAGKEYADLPDGHLLIGSGGTHRRKGVALILHERWSKRVKIWRAVSDRLLVVDLKLGRKVLRIMVAYMPTLEGPAEEVDGVYGEMNRAAEEAEKKGYGVLVLRNSTN
jgi:hypothetical protein